MGTLWLATETGLVEFNPKTERYGDYTTKEGLPDITTTRAVALQAHLPPIIFVMLAVLLLGGSLIASYELSGGTGGRSLSHGHSAAKRHWPHSRVATMGLYSEAVLAQRPFEPAGDACLANRRTLERPQIFFESLNRRLHSGCVRYPNESNQSECGKRQAAGSTRHEHPVEKMGPYLSERQWGTVREDYGKDGDRWPAAAFRSLTI